MDPRTLQYYASDEMLWEAAGRYPDFKGRLQKDALPGLETVPDASADGKTGLDGLLCWAVLMHLPEEQSFDVVFNLRRVLKPGGRLLISTPRTGPVVDEATHRDADGRLFNGVTPENWHFLLAKVGFRLLNRWDSDDSLGRPGRTWATQLFVLEGQASRSLENPEFDAIVIEGAEEGALRVVGEFVGLIGADAGGEMHLAEY